MSLLLGLGGVAFGAGSLPVITEQPQKALILEGSNQVFRVTASGPAPLTYQWRFNGNPLAAQTATTLVLNPVRSADAGAYQVVVSNGSGSVTSSVALLIVHGLNDPFYSAPDGGWAYRYSGDGAAAPDAAALDGTWNHDNGSDAWSGDGRGPGNGLLGGVGSVGGVLTLEDAILSGSTSTDNRRFYFTHDFLQDSATGNATALLDTGVTLHFRARLTPPAPIDPLTELTNAPNGWVNSSDGKGMLGIRQSGGGGMIISFSLNNAVEDLGASAKFTFAQGGLHMNNLNGDVRSPNVDPGEGGALNLLPLDPTAWHEFWVTIQDNGAAPGTHRVAIYLDGGFTPTVFNVTAGTGADGPASDYLALGLGATLQRGAFDLDYFAYKPGVIPPVGFNFPVSVVLQPAAVTVLPGQPASFTVGVTGTPPFGYQWYRDGVAIANGTNASYVTPPAVLADAGATFVVVVTNICNLVTSTPPALLSVVPPPQITAAPQSLIATNGDPARFSVSATGEGSLTYQWRFSGAPLSGEISSAFSLGSVRPADAGAYDVVVSGTGGSTTSLVATLTVKVLDFGDAPDPYPTLLSRNGARHVIAPGIQLGSLVDLELDGNPSSSALGDDLTGLDDEDGVTFATELVAGQLATVRVLASTNGFLDAWVDFNGNGSWADGGEKIFDSQPLIAGRNTLTFLVASTAAVSNSFARFRFSTAGGLSFDGPAADGEVEDYAVILRPAAEVSVAVSGTPAFLSFGSNLVYTVSVRNSGPSKATGVVLSNTLPANAAFVSVQSSQGSCGSAGGDVTCTLGNMAAGAEAVVTLVVLPSGLGNVSSAFGVRAGEIDVVPFNNFVQASTLVGNRAAITQHPASLTVAPGDDAGFSVAAVGSPVLSYQWFYNGAPLDGEDRASLNLSGVRAAQNGDYSVRVSNDYGSELSRPATLAVLSAPVISRAPLAQTGYAGGQVRLSVQAVGTEPLAYQWFFNETNAIPNGLNPTLTLSNLKTNDAGAYQVRVTNSIGTVLSAAARLTVLVADFGDAPDPAYSTLLANNGARHLLANGLFLGTRVDSDPDGQPDAHANGDNANGMADEDGITFSSPLLQGLRVEVLAVASSNGFLNAWVDFNSDGSWSDAGDQVFTNEFLLPGTNVLSFVVPATAKAGTTFARFRLNSLGNLSPVGLSLDGEVEDYEVSISSSAEVGLLLTGWPSAAPTGSNLTYQVTVTNQGPASASDVRLTDVLPSGLGFVSASTTAGSCSSFGATVTCLLGSLPVGGSARITFVTLPATVRTATNEIRVTAVELDPNPANNLILAATSLLRFPSITTQPRPQSVTNGGSATFSVTATATSPRYQWYFNGSSMTGRTNSSLTLSNLLSAQAGTYRVTVSNAVGMAVSDPALLSVLVPPSFTLQPQPQAVRLGAPITLRAAATGTEPLYYQWLFNGGDIQDQTNATLRIENAQLLHSGTYSVLAGNAAGTLQSARVLVTVSAPPLVLTPPQGKTFYAGGVATLEVQAVGTQPLNYQWFVGDNVPLLDATNAMLKLAKAQKSQSGTYSVRITNTVGTTFSDPAVLKIDEVDFGDAPDIGYPTTLDFNGAGHVIVPGVYLGAGVDFEPNGQPSDDATGDDLSGAADEDGVIFNGGLYLGQATSLNVIASTNGFLDAWIDYNQNGIWVELGEKIFHKQPLVGGTNILSFQIPASATLSNTFARFRFSTVGGLSDNGIAPDGEVEDYQVTIQPAVDLALSATTDPVLPGLSGDFSYVIRVTNSGPSTATGVVFRDPVPSAVTFVSAVSSQGDCSNVGGEVLCDLGAMPSGTEAVVLVLVTPQRLGTVRNVFRVQANEHEATPADNSLAHTASVVASSPRVANANLINLPQDGPAALYPSVINISGLTSAVYSVSVTLSNLAHTFPDDLDILLVGPGGQNVLLMSDAGGGDTITNLTLTFADQAGAQLPDSGRILPGTYQPTDYGIEPDLFPAPAPAAPYGTKLSVFQGTNPNGAWSLYVVDDEVDDVGFIKDGWSLTITTADSLADVALSVAGPPPLVFPGSDLSYRATVSNLGPSVATQVVLTDQLPPNAELIAVTADQGACTVLSGIVRCDLGTVEVGAKAVVTWIMKAGDVGVVSNIFEVNQNERDLVPANNRILILTGVKPPTDLAITQQQAPDPVPLGQAVTYTLVAENRGMNPAAGVWVEDTLPVGFALSSATPGQGTCSPIPGGVRCDLGSLDPGKQATITLIATATASGPAKNTVRIGSQTLDSDPSNDSSTSETGGVVLRGPVTNHDGLLFTDAGPASSYPSIINVSGLDGVIYKVTISLSDLNHNLPADLDLLLVGPGGQAVMLMSGAGGRAEVTGVNLTFDDAAPSRVPAGETLLSGVYQPTAHDVAKDLLPAPAPAGPYPPGLSVFKGSDPNGAWSLYVHNRQSGDFGYLGDGWSVSLALVDRPFANSEALIFADAGVASSYPSSIYVSGLDATTYSVTVDVNGFTHESPADVDMLLVAPSGQSVLLMSDAGADGAADGLHLEFNDNAFQSLPENGQLTSGIYRPSNYGVEPDIFPAPAPSPVGEYATKLSALSGSDPNGYWLLYVLNDTPGHVGYFGEGWSLAITTLTPFADVGLLSTIREPNPVAVGSNLTFTLTVTNQGPATAKGIFLTDFLPDEVAFVSVQTGQGACGYDAGVVSCSMNDLPSGGSQRIWIVVVPTRTGDLLNLAGVLSDTQDFHPENNQMESTVTAGNGPVMASQPRGQTVLLGGSVTFTASASGDGPLSYQWRHNGVNLVGATRPSLTLDKIKPGDEGSYVLVASNWVGIVRSAPAELSLLQDFGDAPEPAYPTLLSHNGARHILNPEVYLGARVDGEPDGLPSAAANGDDGSGSADEDGVRLLQALRQGQSASLEVVASTNGFLDAWIDFDRNGSWADPGDQIFARRLLHKGTNVLDLAVPLAVRPGLTFARFRFSSVGGLSFDGLAPDGEVEDYSFEILGVADVGVVMTAAPAPVAVGGKLVYTLTVTNRGPGSASGVVVTNRLPSAASLVSITPSQGSCSQAGGLVTCNLGGLAKGGGATIEIVVMPNASGILTAYGGLDGGRIDLKPADNLTGANTPFVSGANLSGVSNQFAGWVGMRFRVGSVPLTVSALGRMVAPGNAGSHVVKLFRETEGSDLPGGSAVVNVAAGTPGTFQYADLPAPVVLSPDTTYFLLSQETADGDSWYDPSSGIVTLPDATCLGSAFISGSGIVTSTAAPNRAAGPLDFKYAAPLRVAALLPPTFTEQPRSVTATSGDRVTLRAIAAGDPTLFFQWQFSGAPLQDQTNNTLVIDSIRTTQQGNYAVAVSNQVGAILSQTVQVTVLSQPVISPLVNQTLDEDVPSNALAFTVDDPATAPESLTVTAASSNLALFPINRLVLGGTGRDRTLLLNPASNLFGVGTITLTVRNPAGQTSSRSFDVTVNAVNDPPTLDPIQGLAVDEDSPRSGVSLAGITAGPANENQTVILTAVSSDPTIIPNPFVTYSSPSLIGLLEFQPVANASGVVTITVTADDGQAANNLFSRSFTVTVRSINDLPSISTLPDQTTAEDTPTPALVLRVQDLETPAASLVLTGRSTNPTLVPSGGIVFSGSGSNRVVTVTPGSNQVGTANIVLTVKDADGGSVNSQFRLTVTPVNDPPSLNPIADVAIAEDSGVQTVNLSGINAGATNEFQALTVTASSDNPGLITNLVVNYTSPASIGTLQFGVVSNAFGRAVVTVTVNDGQPENNTGSRSFNVVVSGVNDLPSLSDLADQTTDEDHAFGPVTFQVSDLESPAASLTLSGSSSNPALVPNENIIFGGHGASRTLTVFPATNQFGTTVVTVKVVDGDGGEASDTFVLTVNSVEDAPTLLVPADQTRDEDQVIGPLAFVVGDAETSADALLVTVVSSKPALIPSANISLGGAGVNRSVTLKPLTNAFGSTTITIRVSDGTLETAGSFVVTLNPVNDPPVLAAFSDQVINENGVLGPITFTVSDVDDAVGDLTLSVSATNPSLFPPGGLVLGGSGANRTLQVTPATSLFGTGTISLTVRDPKGALATRSFLLTVLEANHPPTISELANQATSEDTPLTLPFRVDDGETAAANLRLSALSSNPALFSGTNIRFSGAGNDRFVTLTPATNQFGVATITLTVTDGDGSTASRTFLVTVSAENDVPFISDIPDQTVNEDTPTAIMNLVASDPETPAANLVLSTSSSNLKLVPNENIVWWATGTNFNLVVTPAKDQFGTSTILVTVTDLQGTSASDSFVLTVNPVNDPPTLSDVLDVTTDEDTPRVIPLLVGDVETPAGNLTLSASSSDPRLVPLGNVTFGGSGSNRTVTILPGSNEWGSATIVLTVKDAGGATASNSFVLRVNPTDDPPSLSAIPNRTISEDTATGPIAFTVGAEVSDPADLGVKASSSNPALVPASGISLGGSGRNRTVTLVPATNQFGTATITLTVQDPNGLATRGSFLLNVTPVNDPPTLSEIPDQVMNEDGSISLALAVSDEETLASNLVVNATSSNPALVPDTNLIPSGTGPLRSLTVNPLPNQSGTAVITVTVRDGNGATASTSFLLTVNPLDDPPFLSVIADQTISEDTATGPIGFTLAAEVSDPSDLGVKASSSNSALVPPSAIFLGGSGSNRTVTVVPATNQFGTATITLTVQDPNGLSTRGSFLLTVTPVNDPPALSGIPDQFMNEGGSISVPLAVSDDETPAANLTVSATSSNPALVPNPNVILGGAGPIRSLTINPLPNQSGTTIISVRVSDGNGGTASKSFLLTVTPVNHPPTLGPISDLTLASNAGVQTVNLTGIGSGAPNENQPLSLSAVSSNPALIPQPGLAYISPNANGTLTFTPAPNGLGTATITVTVNDGQAQNNTASRRFNVRINPPSGPPVIANIPDQFTNEDTPLSIPFTVGDPDTALASLTFSVTSTNTTLLPATNVVVNGSGADRTLTVTPARDQFGRTLVTVTVSDGTATANDSFLLTVNPVNDPPTLDPLPDLAYSIRPNAVTITLTNITSGASNETQTLSVTAASSNTSTVPAPTVVYSSANRTGTLSFRPANTAARTTITVTVRDDGTSNNIVTRSFDVYLRSSVNTAAPTISAIADQTVNEDTPTSVIPFTIGDTATAASLLTVAATSSNPTLVSNGSIVLGGSGANRTIQVTPAQHQSGTATITMSVNDDAFGHTNTTFRVIVSAVNDLPSLSAISDQTIPEDSIRFAVPFTVGDVETPANLLTASATSSNPTLVPNANLVVGGSGTGRALLITPAANQTGVATITVTVADGNGGSTNRPFQLTVTGVNDLPFISDVADQTIGLEGSTPALAVTVGDLETDAASLVLAGVSSNPTLVPNGNLVFGGSASNRTVTVTGAAGQSGTTTITLTVDDRNGGTASDSFLLTVNPSGSTNRPPTLDAIDNLFLNEGAGKQTVLLTGIQAGAPGEIQVLAVAAVSSNPALIPHPTVSYLSPGATAALTFTPVPGASGIATITVTVGDGQAQNGTVTRTFDVIVDGLPQISGLSNVFLAQNVVNAPVPFTVFDRETPAADLVLTVVSDNQSLLPSSGVTLVGTGTNLTLLLTPVPNQVGFGWVYVYLQDNNFTTVVKPFLVFVKAGISGSSPNQAPTLDAINNVLLNEGDGKQTVLLTGIQAGAPNENQVLAISAVSSNPALIPHPMVNYTSPNATATLTFTPVPEASGVATITVTVSDGQGQNGTVTRTFDVTVDGLPRISGLNNVFIDQDVVKAPVPFTVFDAETPASDMVLTVVSDNQALLPSAGVTLVGTGTNLTLLLTPVPKQLGFGWVYVYAQDNSFKTVVKPFLVFVKPVNHLPTLDVISDVTLDEDTVTQLVRLTGIGTGELNEDQPLSVTAVSSNPEVIPNPVIGYTYPSPTGNLSLTPATNATGVAIITVTVSDGRVLNGAVSRTFKVTVNSVNDLPTISDIPDLETEADTPTFVPFQVGDVETPAGSLTVKAVSSNSALLPSANVVLGGSGKFRTATLTPVTSQTGSATVTLTVTDANGATASDAFTLTVRSSGVLPSITTQPQSLVVKAGDSVSFLVVATGSGSLSYQWQHDGADLPGENNATLSLSSARAEDAGNYGVTVSNSKGKVVSQLATLRVLEPPVISLITYSEAQARISFSSVIGLTYTLEWRDSPDTGTWTAITSASGNGGVLTLDDNGAPPARRMYRIRVE